MNFLAKKYRNKTFSFFLKALRTNRTLLALSLSNNRIGDQGAKSFSEVISRFALTFEEILYRRQVFSGRNGDKSVC